MKIKTWIKYTEGYLPTERSRKLRYKECEEFVDLELKEVSKMDLTLSLIVGESHEIYSYNDILYSIASSKSVSNFEIADAFNNLKYCHENCSSYFGFKETDTKEKMISKATKDLEKYLLVDGVLYIRTPEPMYKICTFGLADNHGGTSLSVVYGYNSNSSHGRYFNALDRGKAIKSALEVAKFRGDTESISSIENAVNIEVLNGYKIQNYPKEVMKEFEFLASYLRECDSNKDFHIVIRIVAESKEQAESILRNCTIEEILERLEDDYIEDTLEPISCLSIRIH